MIESLTNVFSLNSKVFFKDLVETKDKLVYSDRAEKLKKNGIMFAKVFRHISA